jgi:hypothetical protein
LEPNLTSALTPPWFETDGPLCASSSDFHSIFFAIQIEKMRERNETVVTHAEGEAMAAKIGACAYMETSGTLFLHQNFVSRTLKD